MNHSCKSKKYFYSLIKSCLGALLFLGALSASVLAQGSRPGDTPDTMDITDPPVFPGSIDVPGPLSEQDRNLVLGAYQGDLARVEVLVGKGANVNVQDQKKRTPLIFAATNGHTSVVEFLISKGAKVNAQDSGGRSALLYAAKRSFNETAALLIEKGADINVQSKKKGVNALMLAAVWDNVELVQMLLKQGADTQLTDIFGRTAKVLAEKKGNKAVVDLLAAPATP
ncbi:MAG: ankyrin repeat domain-containing protein [Halieaceae bacterium]